VVSSHALAEVEQTVDEVLIFDRGRLLSHRSMSDIDSLEEAFLELMHRKEPSL
jgi:ABC-type multidrug transport system ATPase subunit